MFSWNVRRIERCNLMSVISNVSAVVCSYWWFVYDPGGYFGLRSYGDVPTFKVDFLTQNILDRVQI